MEAFADTLAKGFTKYFSTYGAKQIHLWLLVTHPDYRRRGAGTILCKWGLEQATQKGWVLTVIASPLGKLIYEHLGYRLLGSAVVQVDEEDEKLTVYYLDKGSEKELENCVDF